MLKPRLRVAIASSGLFTIAGVILDAAARLEAEAVFLVVELRRALPGGGHLDHLRLHAFDRFLERVDLRLQQLDLGLGGVDRGRLGDRRIRRRVRLIGNLGRLLLLCQGRRGREHGGTAQQRRNQLQLSHNIPFPPASMRPSPRPQAGAIVSCLSAAVVYLTLARLSGVSPRAADWLRARIPVGAAIRPARRR